MLIIESDLKRQLSLVKFLLQEGEVISLKKLSQLIESSARTCENDLIQISRLLPTGWEVYQVGKGMWKLSKPANENYFHIYGIFFKKSITFQLITNAFQFPKKNFFRMCESTFVSRAHLYKKIVAFNQLLPEQINFNARSMDFEGNEFYVRLLFWIAMTLVPNMKFWNISQEFILDGYEKTKKIEDCFNLHFSIISRKSFVLWLEICTRRQRKHPISDIPIDISESIYSFLGAEHISILKSFSEAYTNINERHALIAGLYLNAQLPVTNQHLAEYIDYYKLNNSTRYQISSNIVKKMRPNSECLYQQLVVRIIDLQISLPIICFLEYFDIFRFYKPQGKFEKDIKKRIASIVEEVCTHYGDKEKNDFTNVLFWIFHEVLPIFFFKKIKIHIYNRQKLIAQTYLKHRIESELGELVEVYTELKNESLNSMDIIITDGMISIDEMATYKKVHVICWNDPPLNSDWECLKDSVYAITNDI